ncbi:hypothetical protein RUM43_010368 [Polyplax serrata]|uniref:KASH domain-containing protein n=1 Tax=Polyplax serrata TaxID=468196 RepID=A0AAN8PVQ3_POLSC
MVSVQVQTDFIKENWEGLKTTAEIQKAKQLKNEMNALKTELLNWAASIESMETTVTSREELKAKIIQIKDELNSMEKGKSKLLQANVSVHRFLSIAKNAEPTLRDEVIELYRVWDQTFSRVTTCLFNLQSLSQAWDDFDDHLSQLQCALRTDTLKVIDFALQCGTSSEVTGSLRGIAGLLSEKDSTSKDSVTIRDESITGVDCRPLLTALNTEGSLSDSGISDSGSEQELSDREKRLVQLKRLAKRLESILSPSSQALTNMFKRIEETESGLRELQKTCRDLIVRSSSAEEFKMIVSKSSSLEALDGALGTSYPSGKASSVTKRNRSKGLHKVPEISRGEIDSVDDKEEDKSSRKSWLWRLVRFALPFQLALVALLCVACLMEPRCCDSLNNLDLSLYPQVRYASGPPPV